LDGVGRLTAQYPGGGVRTTGAAAASLAVAAVEVAEHALTVSLQPAASETSYIA